MKSARLIVAGALGLALVCSWSPAASAQQNQRRSKKYIATRQITVDQQNRHAPVADARRNTGARR